MTSPRATDGAPGPRGRVVLTRSPFAPPVIARGALVAAGLILVAAAVGLPLAAVTPLAGEVELLAWVGAEGAPWRHGLGIALSSLGHGVSVTAVAALVAVLARRRLGSWDVGLLLLVALGGSTVVTAALKLCTARVRPDEALVTTFSSAFPSGHTVRAAVVYGLLGWLAARLVARPGARVVVAGATVVLLLAPALGRLLLAVHWPTDVLGGLAVGAAWLTATLWLLQPRVEGAGGGGQPPTRGGVGADA